MYISDYTVLQCAFDLPVVSLGRKLQTVVVVCIFLLTEGKFTFVCILQRSPSHQDTLKWGHLDEQERFASNSPRTVPVIRQFLVSHECPLRFHCILLHRVTLLL